MENERVIETRCYSTVLRIGFEVTDYENSDVFRLYAKSVHMTCSQHICRWHLTPVSKSFVNYYSSRFPSMVNSLPTKRGEIRWHLDSNLQVFHADVFAVVDKNWHI